MAKLNETNKALRDAVNAGDANAVYAALANKANPDLKNGVGRPLLSVASAKGDIPVMEALIKGGAYIDRVSAEGSALALALAKNQPKAAELLIVYGADCTDHDISSVELSANSRLIMGSARAKAAGAVVMEF